MVSLPPSVLLNRTTAEVSQVYLLIAKKVSLLLYSTRLTYLSCCLFSVFSKP